MTDLDQLGKQDLVGIKGWLLFYVVSSIIGILSLIFEALFIGLPTHLFYRLFMSVFLAAFLVEIYLILQIRKPVTRSYVIWLNLIVAWLLVFSSIQVKTFSRHLVETIGLLVWVGYWIGSKRVRATYCRESE